MYAINCTKCGKITYVIRHGDPELCNVCLYNQNYSYQETMKYKTNSEDKESNEAVIISNN